MSSAIVTFENKLKDFVQRVTGFLKKAVPVVKKVFKNLPVQQVLNSFGKFVTSDKKSPWGDNLNKTTMLVEETYHTFTKEMNESEEPPSRIDATKDKNMQQYFTNIINRLSSLMKKKKKK
jgi:hypothetical protein